VKRPTIADVAKRAGVSKGTVSFVLNDKAGVAAATRERILTAMQELGWRPDIRARALTSRRAYALGLVLARPARLLDSDPFFAAFIAGVESELAPRGQALVLQVVENSQVERAGYERMVADSRVDGAFLADLRVDDPRIGLLAGLGLPAVTLGRPVQSSPFPAVVADDAAGLAAVVDHLVTHGHTRIAHVAGPRSFLHGTGREAAWRAALRRHGLRPGPVRRGDFSPQAGASATRALLHLPDPPTAIVYANDVMAIAGLTVAHQLRVRVPDELSITGFDDTLLAGYVSPPLTTVRIDAYAWGQQATRTLLQLIETGTSADVALPPPRLLVRESTGPAPLSKE
jgi:DNA-binding LacI/PurR family transcriptional regulator